MNSSEKLTLAFLDSAPNAAAQVLQNLTPAEGSAFLETVPARLAAPVLADMIPWQAARRFELISAARAAMVLRQLPFFEATTLVRLVRREFRDELLREIPTKFARRLNGALQYPRHQVGAWIDPDVPTLNADNTANDALRLLRAAGPASHIFLESPDHGTFLGAIEVKEILRADPSTPLRDLHITKNPPVSNRASLSAVTFDERWDDSIHLPVVGRRGNLLGGLSRASLRSGVHEQFSAHHNRGRSVLGSFVGAMLTTFYGLLGVVVRSAQPHPDRVHGDPASER
jgi:Mg/Co/Ni transporter MgtE